ncbi:sugar phosphate isomerase/epimerase [Parapedobacter sp. DT-150]|uniref:sugar phosphate isomerase/epimerase n=1 Tax=Parapedobacter sp. DT-150 TaxID=3396162 RepID=UPI003F1CCCDD
MAGILFFCPRWGAEEVPWTDFLVGVKSAGYNGVEVGIAKGTTIQEMDTMWEAAEKRGLVLIIQHYDTSAAEFSKHYDAYADWFEKIRDYPAVKVNSQTGRDFFTYEQNKALIDLATGFTAASGLPVFHETHRSKFSFAAHVTQAYLAGIPDLRITLDISHWICVAETYLADQPDAVTLAIQRTGHLHARVGYTQGPQVPDPRVAEWRDALDIHLRWWDQVVGVWKARNEARMTITPEFGPSPYMVHLPGTLTPISDQWEVNRYMMELLGDRYRG